MKRSSAFLSNSSRGRAELDFSASISNCMEGDASRSDRVLYHPGDKCSSPLLRMHFGDSDVLVGESSLLEGGDNSVECSNLWSKPECNVSTRG